MGFSTLVQGLLFHQAATRRGQRALILAHTEEATRNLFSISRLFYDELPPLLRPMARSLTGGEMVFQNPRPGGEPRAAQPHPQRHRRGAGRRPVGEPDAGPRLGNGLLGGGSEGGAGRADAGGAAGEGHHGLYREHRRRLRLFQAAVGPGPGRGRATLSPLFFPWSELPDYRRPARGLRPPRRRSG